MTEQELQVACRDVGYGNAPYESAVCYGIGMHLRAYARYPEALPLCVATDHGPSQRDVPTYLELQERVPVMLYHSRRLAQEWRKLSKTPCAVMFSPFVFFRRHNRVERAPGAKGTLAFPVHSTDLIDGRYDAAAYIEELLSLPEQFHPVAACLYFRDIQRGGHRVFQDKGIPVYTAGHIYDPSFTRHFYDILRDFSFATSNHFGSYAFYAVEMGIPFFIHGSRPLMVNKGDPNSPDGAYDPCEEFGQLRKATLLFSGPRGGITEEQVSFVRAELGLEDGLGRLSMALLLHYGLFRWWVWRLLRVDTPVRLVRRLRRMLAGKIHGAGNRS